MLDALDLNTGCEVKDLGPLGDLEWLLALRDELYALQTPKPGTREWADTEKQPP